MKYVDEEGIDANIGRFRKLTPRECLRLMGFDDTFKIVVSDTEAYKQAGNSIVVNVLMALLKQIDITQYGTEV
jgi:DNA (cytosine-5)-methyltransferase 1